MEDNDKTAAQDQKSTTAEEPCDHTRSGSFSHRRSGHAFCPVCGKQVELTSFENAARLFHTDLQDIQFLAKKRKVHQVHNRKGKVMICSVSLFECFENRRTRLLDSGILREIEAAEHA